MQQQAVRIGIIGLGNMGRVHAQTILDGNVPGMELAAVCDADVGRLAPWRDKGIATFTDYRELLPEVEAVLIATPHYSHTGIGIEALRAGLHVLVEKPISVHKADCERLVAAHDGRSVFAAMFNQRTDPAYVKLKAMIEGGGLGAIHRINWIITNWYRTQAYYDSGGWRATWAGEGGGVLLNQCPHQLDLYQWLFGMPARVRAFCQVGRFHKIEVEDAVTAYLEHPGGATGVFITTTGEAPGTNRLEVAADSGRVLIEGGRFRFTRNVVPTSEHLVTEPRGFTPPEVEEVEIQVEGHGEQHLGVLKNFAAACLRGEPLIAPAGEGIHSVELANAMLYSSALGQVIDLPLDGGAYAAWLAEQVAQSKARRAGSAG